MEALWQVVNAVVSLGIITLLFAMIFKILPDVRIAWKDVWVGAFVTGVLFTLGKFLLGLWLGKNAAVSAYGAAGSLVLVLLWVYYSSQILFFGAEITQVYANRYGTRLEPKPHARWVDPSVAPAPGKIRGKVEPAPSSLTPAERQARLVEKLRQQVEAMKARRMRHRLAG
jgi:membrane protein